jgi:ABC-type Fe3+-siderophore transport system permease subunit
MLSEKTISARTPVGLWQCLNLSWRMESLDSIMMSMDNNGFDATKSPNKGNPNSLSVEESRVSSMRRINLSAALIVLICFFLPWVQVSCAGARDSLSGLDLARQGEALLWLVPLLVCAVLVFGLLRHRSANPQIFGFLSSASGAIVLFLLNRERVRAHDDDGLLAAQLTGWFWLSFISTIAMIGTALAIFFQKRRAIPE